MDTSLIGPAVIAAVIAALGTAWQLTRQQRQANRAPFLQKQLEVCFRVIDVASRLASETDPVEWEKARVSFWQLYWGPLSMVEDKAVEKQMIILGYIVPERPVPSQQLPMLSLGPQVNKLAHVMRGLLLASWEVEMEPLAQLRPEAK